VSLRALGMAQTKGSALKARKKGGDVRAVVHFRIDYTRSRQRLLARLQRWRLFSG
jgi:hypothetical protein